MKILHLINGYSPVFGCGVADRCQKMAKHLAEMGHDVVICSGDKDWDPDYAKQSGKASVLKFKSYLGRFAYTPGLKKFLDSGDMKFDLVHLMNHWTYQNALGYEFAKRNQIPIVFSAMGALPIVGRSQWIKKAYQSRFGVPILKESAACIAITQTEVNTYQMHGVESRKIHFLPNGIDDDEYSTLPDKDEVRKNLNIKASEKVILYLGRLAHIKGTDILVNTFVRRFKTFENVKLVIVGPDYGLLEPLKNTVAKFNMQNRVVFTGPLSGQKKLQAYQSADLFVVPSRQENMSIVAVEAAACSVPVVITDVCDFDEIRQRNAGKVVAVTEDAIFEGIHSILTMEPENYREMCLNARRMVEELFTWRNLSLRLESILNQVVRNRTK